MIPAMFQMLHKLETECEGAQEEIVGPCKLPGMPRPLSIPLHSCLCSSLEMPLVWLCRTLDCHLETGSNYPRLPEQWGVSESRAGSRADVDPEGGDAD